MRIVGEIPHEVMKITIFQWNGKYIVKFEISHFEQSYKFSESTISSLSELKKKIGLGFQHRVLQLFGEMREEYEKLA